MRRKHNEKKNAKERPGRQARYRHVLQRAMSLVSHVAAIVGTCVAIIDLIQQCYGGGADGVYKFVPASSTTERTVHGEVTGLILDALRMIDEQGQSSEKTEEVNS